MAFSLIYCVAKKIGSGTMNFIYIKKRKNNNKMFRAFVFFIIRCYFKLGLRGENHHMRRINENKKYKYEENGQVLSV